MDELRAEMGAAEPEREVGRSMVHIKRKRGTLDELRTRARAWEAAHPGYGSDNWVDAFRDEEGDLIESFGGD